MPISLVSLRMPNSNLRGRVLKALSLSAVGRILGASFASVSRWIGKGSERTNARVVELAFVVS